MSTESGNGDRALGVAVRKYAMPVFLAFLSVVLTGGFSLLGWLGNNIWDEIKTVRVATVSQGEKVASHEARLNANDHWLASIETRIPQPPQRLR